MTFAARFRLFAAAALVTALVTALVACTKSAPAVSTSDSMGVMPGSDANVGVVKAYVDAWNKRDTLGMDSLLGPGGIHDDVAQGFHGVGPTQVNGFMRAMLKTQPDYKWSVTSTFTDGPHVAMEWTWTATYTGPGPTGMVKNLPLSGRGASIVEVENGKIKQFTDYYDNASFFPRDTTRK